MLPLSISPNIPRIYTAIAEWLSCMICLLEVKHRVNTRRFILISAGVLFLQSIFLYLTPGLDNLLWILCMAAAGLMMYAFKLATTSSTGGLSLALQRAIVTARPKGRYRKHFYWPAIKRYYWNLLFSIPLLAHLYISELLHLLYCRLFQHNIL